MSFIGYEYFELKRCTMGHPDAAAQLERLLDDTRKLRAELQGYKLKERAAEKYTPNVVRYRRREKV